MERNKNHNKGVPDIKISYTVSDIAELSGLSVARVRALAPKCPDAQKTSAGWIFGPDGVAYFNRHRRNGRPPKHNTCNLCYKLLDGGGIKSRIGNIHKECSRIPVKWIWIIGQKVDVLTTDPNQVLFSMKKDSRVSATAYEMPTAKMLKIAPGSTKVIPPRENVFSSKKVEECTP